MFVTFIFDVLLESSILILKMIKIISFLKMLFCEN